MAGWRDVELDGVWSIGWNPGLRQRQHVELMVSEDVVDDGCLVSSGSGVEQTERHTAGGGGGS